MLAGRLKPTHTHVHTHRVDKQHSFQYSMYPVMLWLTPVPSSCLINSYKNLHTCQSASDAQPPGGPIDLLTARRTAEREVPVRLHCTAKKKNC